MKVSRCWWLAAFLVNAGAFSSHAAILEEISEALPLVERLTSPQLVEKPVRDGAFAFKHVVGGDVRTSEIVSRESKNGGECWYGWALQLPEEFDSAGKRVTLARFTAGQRDGAKRKFSCEQTDSHLYLDEKGRLIFHLHHPGKTGESGACDEFVLADERVKLKGVWLDFVVHAKWTEAADGFVELWGKRDDNNFFQRVNYKGSTWWSEEAKGPRFALGISGGESGKSDLGGLTLYTDEFRYGNESSSFNDVAPHGGEKLRAEAGRGRVGYVLYSSPLNQVKIPIMVYTPPGYETDTTKQYPVVYNLHGAGGGSPARQWMRTQKTLTQAMDTAEVPPMIIVFVNGIGDSGFVDHSGTGAPKVFSSVTTELIPFIDSHYRTIANRHGRAVDGFSMGGGGAMTLAMKRPDLFSSVVTYGGSFLKLPPDMMAKVQDPRRREMMTQFAHWEYVPREAAAVRQAGLRVRIICGDKDPAYQVNVAFKELLESLKIPVSWVTVEGLAHETTGLYNHAGVESFRFMQEGFKLP